MENVEKFEDMLEQYLPDVAKGETKKGKIINKDNEFCYIDVGTKGIGKLRVDEAEEFNIGDEIEVMVSSQEEDREGYIRVSRKVLELKINWEKLNSSFKDKKAVDGKIVKKVNGGYIVNVFKYECFMPGSLSLINEKDEDNFMGKKMKFMIKDIVEDGTKKKIVVSRREMRDIELKDFLEKIKIGDVVDAEIKEVLGFGLTVNLGPINGFVHISEVSWKKLERLEPEFKVGQKVKAKVIDVEEKTRNVKLSIKQLKDNPRDKVLDKYKLGDEVPAKIVKIEKFGAFAELEEGVEGLIHVSDLSWTKKIKNVDEYLKVGDVVKVRIIEINEETKKIKLGLKQMVQDPWALVEKNYPVGKLVSGKIVENKPFGIFVNLEDGVDAFVHISDLSWVSPVIEDYKVGDTVKAQIIEIDMENKKIKAGLKQLNENPLDKVFKNYKVGDVITSKVKEIKDFALFVEIESGIDGMIHISESSKDFVKKLSEKFKIGDEVKAEIIVMEEDKKRIKLSIKKIETEGDAAEEKEMIEKYSKTAE